MTYVFDSSFIAAILIPDEKNPRIDKIHAAIEKEDEIFVPQLFWYEIVNVFKNLLRRKRCSYNEVMNLFPSLGAIRLTVDFETRVAYSQKLLQLCHDFNLSSYDAAYLELASRKKAVLCTLDEDLRIAARKNGVIVCK
jgi:predicted nucleic acid-binding protein